MSENSKIGSRGRFRLSPPKLNVPEKSAPKKFKLSPPKLKTKPEPQPQDEEISIHSVDIVDEMVIDDSNRHDTFDTSNFRSGIWRAAKPKVEHDETMGKLAQIPHDFAFSFHELVNGEVPSDVVAKMLISAKNYLFPQDRFSDLKDFIGDDTIPIEGFVLPTGPGGLYDFPNMKEVEIIANKLGWSAAVFKDFVEAARMKQEELHESGRIEDYVWSDNLHLRRIYRLLRMGQELGAIVDAGEYLQAILRDQGHHDKVEPEHVVELYGKGASVKFDDFIDAANILEVVLNATWGEKDMVDVPRRIARDGFVQWPPEQDWHKKKSGWMRVSGKELAELAFNRMRGDNFNELGAAIMYSALAEDHLYEAEVDLGFYDFYTWEEARAIAIGDMRENPERYYGKMQEISKLPVHETFSEKLAMERLRELFEGTRFDDLIKNLKRADDLLERDRPLFSDMKVKRKLVQKHERWHHARRFLYGFVAMARFVEAGDAAEDHDPMASLSCYRGARILIGRHYRRREFLYSFTPDELRINLRNIVQPLRYWVRDLKKDLDIRIEKMTEKVRQGLIDDGSGGPGGGISSGPVDMNGISRCSRIQSWLGSLRWFLKPSVYT